MFLRILFLNICILSVLLGCQMKITNREELYKYMQDKKHGVSDSREIKGAKVSISYVPTVMMGNKADSAAARKLLYFKLTYQINDRDMLSAIDPSSYSVLVSRLSFKLGDYISVRFNGKQEEIADFQFSPTYGMTNRTEVIFAIDREKLNAERVFTIHVQDIGIGLPDYDFAFEQQALDRLDELSAGLDKLD
ncbi:hypothetical protein AAW12_23755 [Sphingobacterium sp. Ag1]|nr:hypothetical protein AAW12_23755 [Sphingobacterium sp. Ag1]